MTSNKEIFKITFPIFLTMFMQNVINLTNTAFLGRVGEVELGASAIGGVMYFAIYMIGFGFSQGAQILIGRRNGEKNYSQIGTIFNNSLLFNLLLSLVIIGLCIKGVPSLMKYLVTSENIYNSSILYMNWRIYGLFFAFLGVIFRAYYVGITQTRVLTYSAFVMAVTNIFFDYTLIFGHFGFPKLGIEGAGISSVISEAVTLIYLVWNTVFKTDMKLYGLFEFHKVEIKTILSILNLSVFIMLQFFISISTWFMFFIFIERMGEQPLAISNIGRSIYSILMIPSASIATAASTIVSNMIGANQRDKVMKFTIKQILNSFLIMIPLVILILLFSKQIGMIFTNDPVLLTASLPIIKIVALANLFCAGGFVVFNVVSGTGNTRTAFAMELVTLTFYIIYVYYTTIIHPTTVAMVWGAEFIYWIIMGLQGFLYLSSGRWKKKEI